MNISCPEHPIQNPARRRFLIGTAVAGTALLVGCSPEPNDRLGTGNELEQPKGETALNAWLRIADDNIVTVAVARAEMGQGVSTALPMLVAEELGCDWTQVRYELISPDAVHGNVRSITEELPFRDDDDAAIAQITRWLAPRLVGNGRLFTGRSTSVRDAWEPLRMAGAAARYALIQAAAREWSTSADELSVDAGFVVHSDGRRLAYGELAEAAGRVPLPLKLRLKAPADFKLLGKSLPRLDAPAKVDGTALFGADIRLPDMLHAASRLCPVAGGTLKSLDDSSARKIAGVHHVFRVPSVVGSAQAVVVVANDSWTAQKAAQALKIEWDEGPHASYDSDTTMQNLLVAVNEQRGTLWHHEGDLPAIEKSGARRFDAVYTVPMLAHAAMEPANCTALYKTDQGVARMQIWAPTQNPGLYRQAAAKAADLMLDNIEIRPTLLGGGYGYKALLEPLVQAVTAAKAIPNTPVQLIYTREQDLQNTCYRPPAAAKATAWMTGERKSGRWVGWRQRSAAPSVLAKSLERTLPEGIARLVPDKTMIEGAFDNPYSIDAQEIYHVNTPSTAPLGMWRSGGHTYQTFFVESFIDEVAHQLRQNPLELRLRKLRTASRDIDVLQSAAREAGWHKNPGANSAMGLAVHSAFGSCCAQVVHLVRQDDAKVRIERVVCALDCGFILHPDSVAQQAEGGVIFALSAALYGNITMKQGRVKQSSFADYRLLSMKNAPEVTTVLVPTRATEPGGVSEVTIPPLAPALCNAIFRLTGKRIRNLPIGKQVMFA